ncbi:hypothetical protein [Lactococcus lactis]|uniref:hypothetical protein n=1 Tax=Lactococcus lactis TaxID=1358 RepID=UPI001CA3282B|nr:hypothetical protein [Lactococcus lactis]
MNKKEKEISKMKSSEKTKNDFAKYMRENVVDYDKYVDEYLGISSSSKNEDKSTNKSSDFVNSFGTAQGFSNDDTEIEVNVISANIDQSVKLSDDDLSGKPLVLTVSIKTQALNLILLIYKNLMFTLKMEILLTLVLVLIVIQCLALLTQGKQFKQKVTL